MDQPQSCACPALRPGVVPLAREILPPGRLSPAQTWQRGPDGGMSWKRLIAEHGWETARLQAKSAAHGRCPADRDRAATASRCASLPSPARISPQLCGRDVGRMLHLLLVYALEHPDAEHANRSFLSARTVSFGSEENKIHRLTFALLHLL